MVADYVCLLPFWLKWGTTFKNSRPTALACHIWCSSGGLGSVSDLPWPSVCTVDSLEGPPCLADARLVVAVVPLRSAVAAIIFKILAAGFMTLLSARRGNPPCRGLGGGLSYKGLCALEEVIRACSPPTSIAPRPKEFLCT